MNKLIKNRVRLETKNNLAYVTLARPEKRNGLDFDMMTGLIEAADLVKKDRSLRAVILQGEGKAFCAGLDFASVMTKPLKVLQAFTKYGIKKTNLFQEMCYCWRTLPVPVLAVVQGQCFGGGIQLALAADFRFTYANSEWSIMEAKWGLVPDMTGMVTLRELLPIDVVRELTYTGRIISGEEAKRLGLASHLADDPLAAAETLAAEICTRSPDSVAAAKSLIRQSWSTSDSTALDLESRIQFKLMRGKNHRKLLAANKKKTTPTYVPRQSDYL